MTRASLLLASAVLATSSLLPTVATAQNSNEKSPTTWHGLSFSHNTTLLINYKQLTVAGGTTLEQLTSGAASERVRGFYNERYIPFMIDGRMQFETGGQLDGNAFDRGMYRFTFRAIVPTEPAADSASDEKPTGPHWVLDVYTGTGKRTIGKDLMSIEKGWWEQETLLMSIPLETERLEASEKDADKAARASRLQVLPVAVPGKNDGTAEIQISFGPLRARVPLIINTGGDGSNPTDRGESPPPARRDGKSPR